jgi:hypothetical protein
MHIEKLTRGSRKTVAKNTIAPVVGYPNEDQVKIRFAVLKKDGEMGSQRLNVVLTYEETAELAKELIERLHMRAKR